MNSWQSDALFPLFYILTMIGDGMSLTIISVIIVFFINLRSGLLIGLATALDGIVVQLLKRNVFGDMHRPFYFIDEMPGLSLMDGLKMHENFSFPSGHTSAAFAFFFGLSLLMNKGSWKFLCLVLAALIGYSRVYLSQHFLMDLLAGSLLGIALSYTVYILFQRWVPQEWMNRPLIPWFTSS